MRFAVVFLNHSQQRDGRHRIASVEADKFTFGNCQSHVPLRPSGLSSSSMSEKIETLTTQKQKTISRNQLMYLQMLSVLFYQCYQKL